MHINKRANAFYEDAVLVEIISGVPQPEDSIGNRIKKKNGGLWVGGRVLVTHDGLEFKSNNINNMLHEKLRTIVIPMQEIISADYQFGWVTGIIVLTHINGGFRFRCYGARKVVNEINSYIEKL